MMSSEMDSTKIENVLVLFQSLILRFYERKTLYYIFLINNNNNKNTQPKTI